MTFEGLDISSSSDMVMLDDGLTREQQIRNIADAELQKLVREGRRLCKIVQKFEDPKMQFFHEFLLDEGFEGVGDGKGDDNKGKNKDTEMKVTGRHKYPNAGTRYRRAKNNVQVKDSWLMREVNMQQCEVIDLTGDDDEEETTFTLADIMKDFEDTEKQIAAQQGDADQDNVLLDDALEAFKNTRVGLEVEDEATLAVREAFGKCVLT